MAIKCLSPKKKSRQMKGKRRDKTIRRRSEQEALSPFRKH